MKARIQNALKATAAAVVAVSFLAASSPASAQWGGYGYGPYDRSTMYGGGYGGAYGGGVEEYYDRMESRTDELDDESIYVTEAMEDYYNLMESRSDMAGYRGYGGYGGLYRDYSGYYDWGW
ncbi:MAG TPA: hypothetical protein VGN83_04895 [Falsiroseomonas sp.]|jgi:hypothetical protein|nr:hypothetical protein [Falsiroseomonas sp.]